MKVALCFMLTLASLAGNGQPNPFLEADSLFAIQKWTDAIPLYEKYLKTDAANALEWNRLGYCYQNTANYQAAINAYTHSLQNKPTAFLEQLVSVRLARIYAHNNQKQMALDYLTKALAAGYSNTNELQTNKDFESLRSDDIFTDVINKARINAYPCLTDKRTGDFDYWIGEWDVYQTGTNYQVGKSKIEKVSGGCMVLENWTAIGAEHNGKSMNYVDPESGKWTQMWVGSGGINGQNIKRFYNGEYKDGAMRFQFEGLNQGTKYIGRFIFYNQGPDQVRQFNEVSSDNGRTWTISYDFTYKRRKS